MALTAPPIREPSEEDVLRIDPVTEYERRRMLREYAEWRYKQIGGDDSDELVARGRPTGP